MQPDLGSCGADIMRASKLQHAVQGTVGDGTSGAQRRIPARVQTIADHPLVAADCRLDPGVLVLHMKSAPMVWRC